MGSIFHLTMKQVQKRKKGRRAALRKQNNTKKKGCKAFKGKAKGFSLAQSGGLQYSLLIPFLITGPQSLSEVNL